MAVQKKGDRVWLVLCTAAGFAVDVTLNKYSSTLSGVAVLCLWAVPAVLLAVWLWRVESTKTWVRLQFQEHPVSYVLMFLIIVTFGWQATSTMVHKFISPPQVNPPHQEAPASQVSPVEPPMPTPPVQVPLLTENELKKVRAEKMWKVSKLLDTYRATHPGPENRSSEIEWINAELVKQGIPVIVSSLSGRAPTRSSKPPTDDCLHHTVISNAMNKGGNVGFHIQGDPCVIITDANNIDTKTGFDIDSKSSNELSPHKNPE